MNITKLKALVTSARFWAVFLAVAGAFAFVMAFWAASMGHEMYRLAMSINDNATKTLESKEDRINMLEKKDKENMELLQRADRDVKQATNTPDRLMVLAMLLRATSMAENGDKARAVAEYRAALALVHSPGWQGGSAFADPEPWEQASWAIWKTERFPKR